ncbi:MAG TPA: alcohol dehydrogenase [Clostridiales bacterium]|jgi:NADPH:quinone reductase-like Zn-dependent oxidoreductase|nr:alcohol dehydrogenase [Clostridiales bacterium]
MKAMVYDKALPARLALREVEDPVPQRGEVLIRVYASSINAADYRSMRLGIVPKNGIYGADVAGTVVRCGADTSRFAVGDEVLGDLADSGFGGFAEFVAAPEALLSKKPAGVSFETAAAVPLAGGTALQAIRLAGDLAGKRVLIIGASGGVGSFALQLAKINGAVVTAVTSTRNLDQARALGADYVCDYTKENPLAKRAQYDRIFVMHGDRRMRDLRFALATGGIAVIVGGALKRVIQASLLGGLYSTGGKRICVLSAKPDAKNTAELMRLVETGAIKPVIERVVPLHEMAQAFAHVARGHAGGKVVVRVA